MAIEFRCPIDATQPPPNVGRKWGDACNVAYTEIAREFPEIGIEGRELILSIMVNNFNQFAERAYRYEMLNELVSDLCKRKA